MGGRKDFVREVRNAPSFCGRAFKVRQEISQCPGIRKVSSTACRISVLESLPIIGKTL
jgi:hypothetical protein